VDNYARFIFATNDEWAVPTGPKERRYCVLELNESKAKDYAYFSAIKTEMDNGGVEALLHKLQTHDLSEFNVREYPITKGLLKQKQLSLTSVAKWWQELLIEGDGYVAAVGYGSHAGIFGTVTATNDLFEIYQVFTQRDRYGHGQVASCQHFVTILIQWAPIAKKRITETNGKRSRCLVIPDLETCRDHFEKAIGHEIDWDAA
jgi:hypothetical protein